MAKNHNISVITVENAYAQLLVEGYIFSKEKRGYFASEISGQYLNLSLIHIFADELEEDVSKIRKIYDIAKEFAPDYNVEKIMAKLG